jgi:general stress protein 26
MSDKTLTQTEAQDRLWDAVEKHQIGMLGATGDGHHFQPMTAFLERETNQLWFFTYDDTDLARSAQMGGEGSFIFQTREVQACIDGTLSVQRDRARMDRYWNAHVAAWYPEGKDDPRLTLLRLDCADAAVWIAEAGPVRYAWEIARANVQGRTPDVGERRDLNLQ